MTAPTSGAGRRAVAAAVFALAAVAIATALAWPIYAVPQAIVLAVVAGVVGVGLGIVSARGTRAAVGAAIALPLAYLALVVPLAVPSATSSPVAWAIGIRDGVAGIVLGWKQLLTLPAPVGDYQAVLVPLFVIVLIGGFGVAALAARPGRRGLASVPVALTMAAFGPLFGSSSLGAPVRIGPIAVPGAAIVLLVVAAVILCLTWLSVRARLERRAAIERASATGGTVNQTTARGIRVGRPLLAAALVTVAVIAGLAVVPAAGALGDRTTLRDRVDPMVVLSRTESPLVGYRGWFAAPTFSTELLTVDPGAAAGLDRLRFATLTEFDGVGFTVDTSADGRFSRLPNSAQADGDVDATITLGAGWTGPWLPTPGILTAAPAFTGRDAAELADGLAVAPGGTTAIVVTGPSSSEAIGPQPGTAYTIAGTPTPSAGPLLEGAAGGESRLDADALPRLAEWVALQSVPRTGAGLLELVERLRERGALSHARVDDAASAGWIAALSAQADYDFEPSLAGHSSARIESLFAELTRQELLAGADADPELLVAGVGDEEQFATAVALLARSFGFDSRVVVGVRLSTTEPLSSVAPCEAGVCTGANVTAWVEVQGPDGTWGTIDVGPQFAVPITRVAEGEILPEHPTSPQRPESELVEPPSSQAGDTGTDPAQEPSAETDWFVDVLPIVRIVGLAVLTIVLLLLPALVLAAAKTIRRTARRHARDPEVAVVGAWEELVDVYVDRGVVAGDRGPRQRTADRAGRPTARSLAEAVDAAVFADAPVSDADRAAAWSMVEAERRELRGEVGVLARIRAALSTRSLVRHLGADAVETDTLHVGRDRGTHGDGGR
jgi:hypothetical protein